MSAGDQLTTIKRRIEELLGLHFAESQWKHLERNLGQAARALQLDDNPQSLYKWITKKHMPARELEILAHHLTVGETYFFRESAGLNLLRDKIIPAIQAETPQQKKSLKIWSAGCSSGEEPYSIAILLRETLADFEQWHIDILATDINTQALTKAQKAVYTPWSFRDTPEHLKKRYFSQKGKNLELIAEIRNMVRFERLNLAAATLPDEENGIAQMDAIFCRNVLMYFSAEHIQQLAVKFHNSLKTNAWLITSQVELNDIYFRNFQRVFFENAIFYRKAPIQQKRETPFKILLPIEPKLAAAKRINRKKQKSRSATISQAPKSQADEKVVKKEVEQPQLQPLDKAEQLFNAGQYTECFTWCEKLRKSNGFDTALSLLLAKAYANSGRHDDAQAVMQDLLNNTRPEADHYYIFASILTEKGEWEQAEKNLVKALYLNPRHFAARLSRGQLLKQLNKPKQAEKEIRQLLTDIESFTDNEPLPYLDGLTAGRLRQLTAYLTHTEEA